MSADWQNVDWDPEQERRAARVRAGELGMDWVGFNGILWACWQKFEAELRAYCQAAYARTGVNVPDWAKAKARSRFRAILIRGYGTADVDPECEQKFKPLDEAEAWRRFGEAASRRFGVARAGGALSTPAEIETGVQRALAAMNEAACRARPRGQQ
jgi:hypothetical protein